MDARSGDGAEGGGEAHLRVEDELGPVQQVLVPDADEAVRVRDGARVLVVRRDRELRELARRGRWSSAPGLGQGDGFGGRTLGDQSRPVTDRFLVQRSSSNVQTCLTVRPLSSSLRSEEKRRSEKKAPVSVQRRIRARRRRRGVRTCRRARRAYSP